VFGTGEDMNDLTQKLILVLVVVPIIFGIFRSWKEMACTAAVIGIALVFANLHKIALIKGAGGGIEVELKTAVREAYAAIEQLKELGLSLSSPIVDELALSGKPLSYIHLKYKLEQAAKISETLKKLGASTKEIDEITAPLYQRVTETHFGHILSSLQQSNTDKEAIFRGWHQWKLSEWNMNRLEDFIKDNALNRSGETQESIKDLEYFQKNRKLRREDRFGP
jgi:hypothetical protein